MRRLLAVTLFFTVLAWLVPTFYAPISAQTTQNPNPHGCNFQPGDFALPQAPECDNPPPGYWDCIATAGQAYRNNRAYNANAECNELANIKINRSSELRDCDTNYNSCVSNGGSAAFCEGMRRDCQRETNRVWDIMADQAGRRRRERDAEATEGFISLCKQCCEGH